MLFANEEEDHEESKANHFQVNLLRMHTDEYEVLFGDWGEGPINFIENPSSGA